VYAYAWFFTFGLSALLYWAMMRGQRVARASS